MEKLFRRLGHRTDPTILFVSAFCMIAFVVALVAAPDAIGSAFAGGRR